VRKKYADLCTLVPVLLHVIHMSVCF